MEGKTRLIIAFFILFIRSGLSQRNRSCMPSSSEYDSGISQDFGASLGVGESDGTETGDSRGGESREVRGLGGWNATARYGTQAKEDSGRKISLTGNGSNQWSNGSGRYRQTGGYGGSGTAGDLTGAFAFVNKQNASYDSKDHGSRNWYMNDGRQPAIQSGYSQTKEDNRGKTNSNSNSTKPGGSVGGSTSDSGFSFEKPSSKVIDPTFGGPSFGYQSKRPIGSTNSNWKLGNQNEDHKTWGLGFPSPKQEEKEEQPSFAWNFGFGGSSRRPQASVIGNSNSGSGFDSKPTQGSSSGGSNWGSASGSKRPQGSNSGSSGNPNWGSSSSSDSKKPQSGSSVSPFPSGSGSTKPAGGTIGDILNINFGSTSNSDFRKPQGSASGGNWNSDSNSNSKKPQSSSGNSGWGDSPSKKEEDNRQRPQFNQRPSSSTTSKPPTFGRPGYTNTQTVGSGKGSESQKPNDSNSNANKPKKEEIDWSKLENENPQGPINFDPSELWHPNDKKDPAWRSIWTRNRFRREQSAENTETSVCHCTDFTACSPENRMDTKKFPEHQDLRERIEECASQRKICCVTPEDVSNDIRPQCGKRMSKLAEHDINNDGANYGDYPWLLRLVAVGDAGEDTICSASLIHSSLALTTASCALLLTGKDVRVRSGEWNVVGGNDNNKMEETTIGKVYLHPDFDVISYRKDLAVLFLDSPFHYSRGANAICLPTHRDAWDASRCMVVGWTKNKSGLKSAVLKQVDLEIVAQGKCRHRDGLKNGLSDLEDPGYQCAHTRKDDPYLGDAGASLLCPILNSDAFIQVGFASKTVPGKRDHKTSTFTDVLESLDWIYRMEGLYTFVTGEDAGD